MTPDTLAAEFIRADPRHRRNALVMFIASTIVCAFIIGWGWPMFRDWLLEGKATGRIRGLWICLGFLGFVGLISLGVTWFGMYTLRLAGRAMAHGQFPPPGTKVIRDTRILRGREALAIARVQRFLGTLLILCAVVLFGLSTYVAWRLILPRLG